MGKIKRFLDNMEEHILYLQGEITYDSSILTYAIDDLRRIRKNEKNLDLLAKDFIVTGVGTFKKQVKEYKQKNIEKIHA